MTRDAALDALGDAGLVATDLDAIFEYSFGMMRGDSPIAVSAQRLLGVPNLTAFNDIMGSGPSGLASAMDAAMAISAGACETALVYRTITREAGHNGGLRSAKYSMIASESHTSVAPSFRIGTLPAGECCRIRAFEPGP